MKNNIIMQTETLKTGQQITYHDGRVGHQNIGATILEADTRKMIVQFDDRADTTTIFFSDKKWMNFISRNN